MSRICSELASWNTRALCCLSAGVLQMLLGAKEHVSRPVSSYWSTEIACATSAGCTRS